MPLTSLIRFTGLFVLLCALASCSKEPTPQEQMASKKADSAEVAKKARALHIDSLNNRFPKINYGRFVLSDKAVYDSIRRTFAKTPATMVNYRALTLLNRKDMYFMRIGDTIVMPDTIMEDLRAYSLFPQYYEGASSIPKIIMLSNTWQAYACYEYGELIRFVAVNAGEERKPTFPGRYAVNWKSKLRLSSLDSTWKLPFTVNFHQHAGSAFHQFEMPGRPVSHSCVRQLLGDAEWLFKWVKTAKYDSVTKRPIPFTGTPVIIIDIFDFNRRRGGPWMDLTSNTVEIKSMPSDPMSVEEALIPISQIPKDSRGSLINRQRYVEAEQILRDKGIIRPQAKLLESIDYNKLRRDKKRRAAAKG